MIRAAILVTILCSLAVGAAAQSHYYVSTSGSDSNDGSEDRPWRTLARANSALVVGPRGAVVHVAPGPYANATLNKAGTSTSARVRWQCDKLHSCKIENSTVQIRGSYIDFDGFEVTGGGNGIDTFSPYHHNTISHNWVHNIGTRCWFTGGIQTSVPPKGQNVAPEAGIGTIVDSNILDSIGLWDACPMYGAAIYVIGPGTTVTNNIVSKAAWGVHLNHEPTDTVIANNTLINIGRSCIVVLNEGDAPPPLNVANNVSVVNNICANPNRLATTSGIREAGTNSGCNARIGANNVYKNNLVYGANPASFFLCGGKTASGTQSGSNSTTFVNYTGNAKTGDYRPRESSAAIGNGTIQCAAGVASCVPSKDIDGLARTNNRLSIGAHQFGTKPEEGKLDPPGSLKAVAH